MKILNRIWHSSLVWWLRVRFRRLRGKPIVLPGDSELAVGGKKVGKINEFALDVKESEKIEEHDSEPIEMTVQLGGPFSRRSMNEIGFKPEEEE